MLETKIAMQVGMPIITRKIIKVCALSGSEMIQKPTAEKAAHTEVA